MLSRHGDHHRRLTPPTSPDDAMVGRCPTCKSVIECKRKDAMPPPGGNDPGGDRDFLTQRSNAEAGGFGAWFELWSVECPVCVAKTSKVITPDGEVQQHVLGPRVYLTVKGK